MTNTQASQPAPKRKYDEISKQIDVGEPMVVQASSSSSEDPLRIIPKLLIPRSCLPLAFLDLNDVPGHAQGNRLFSARIPILEDSTRPMVLIVASDLGSCLYAVERVRHGICALCKLGKWVTLKELERLKLSSCWLQPGTTTVKKDSGLGNAYGPGSEWWRASAVKNSEDAGCRERKKHTTTHPHKLVLCMNTPLPTTLPATLPARAIAEEAPLAAIQAEVAVKADSTVENPSIQPQDPDEVLNLVRAQYQEALYASQASLAYFAKGPLSRARAYFVGDNSCSFEKLSLPGFLRTCILKLSTMDKKYRDTLPSIIEEIPLGVFSEDEYEAISTSLRKKSRKNKTMKIGKDGLYPEENVRLAKWWLYRSESIGDHDSPGNRKDAVRSALLEQRARETQLQIILVLETLALEASKQATSNQDPPSVAEKKKQSSKKKTKEGKMVDLDTLLELLVDRLCIWQSITLDDVSPIQTTSQKAWPEPTHSPTSDVLHNFCTDVILPFYSARLPDLSTQLCHKLGGLKPPSPPRPKLRKAVTSSQVLPKRGALIQRQLTCQRRPTLERVLTEERSVSRKPPPSLSRSTTDSALPRLKREVSEASLPSIPLYNMDPEKSRRYTQREVDLSFSLRAKEAKLKKKALIEQELQGAIAALKKPNPRMAVKELVEAADRRAAGSNLRKPKNLLRNPQDRNVQVMATPRPKRQHDVRSGFPSRPQSYLPEIDEVPPSSALRVISSTPRLRANKSVARNPSTLPTIEQTPTRNPSKVIKYWNGFPGANVQSKLSSPTNLPLSDLAFKLPTTLKSSNNDSLRTPSKPLFLKPKHETSDQRIQQTPVKNLKVPQAVRDFTSSPAGNENDASIYQRLGWDDDADELL